MLGVTSTRKQATASLPCARDPRCRGIQAGEFYFGQADWQDGRLAFCIFMTNLLVRGRNSMAKPRGTRGFQAL